MTLKEFIDNSLNSTTITNEYELSISDEACKAIKKHTQLNVCKYRFIIKEEYIRHIRNRHEEDLDLLINLPDVINSFSSVEKSLTRNSQTGQNEVSLVFRKKFNDDVVRMIALRILKGKILSLKTFFRQ